MLTPLPVIRTDSSHHIAIIDMRLVELHHHRVTIRVLRVFKTDSKNLKVSDEIFYDFNELVHQKKRRKKKFSSWEMCS